MSEKRASIGYSSGTLSAAIAGDQLNPAAGTGPLTRVHEDPAAAGVPEVSFASKA
ncbi:hypothetical protein ACP2WR_25235 [Ralstonia pseudosolanacearum]